MYFYGQNKTVRALKQLQNDPILEGRKSSKQSNVENDIFCLDFETDNS